MRGFEWRSRLQKDQDELFKRLEQLTAVVSRIETEWADTKDQVRRSYQRLEKAGQKAVSFEPPPPIDQQAIEAARAKLDPFSRKLLAVREQTNADAPGTDESTG